MNAVCNSVVDQFGNLPGRDTKAGSLAEIIVGMGSHTGY